MRGETFAMGGASRRHATITGNLFAALDAALEGTPCRAYMADMKLQAVADEAYFYPDVLVTCDPEDHEAEQFMSAPTLVIEVLSPATAACDRGDKFAAYRRIASLKEVLLVEPDSRRIEHYRRSHDSVWELHEAEPGRALEFPSLGVAVAWERIFRNAD